MEVYKTIKKYPEYEISNLGNVRRIIDGYMMKAQKNNMGYLRIGLTYYDENNDRKRKKELIHRLIGYCFIENPDNKPLIDHIDNDRLNNKIENLRWVTSIENARNKIKKLNTSSKYIGVDYHKTNKKWISRITVNKIRKNLGSFDTEKEASDARDNYINEHKLEEFFKLNNHP
jgi:hypothetical protein